MRLDEVHFDFSMSVSLFMILIISLYGFFCRRSGLSDIYTCLNTLVRLW